MNFYEILGIDDAATADASTIRKAYLRQSLLHHPDKNPPERVEEAKARFIQIGMAYETLRDPNKRAIYDRELSRQRQTQPQQQHQQQHSGEEDYAFANNAHSYDDATSENREQTYEKFSDFFDATVAGMSEEDLAKVMLGASLVGALIGSFVGSRLAGGGANASATGGNLARSIGSVVGSRLASEIAVSSVRTLHQQSIQRVEYKQACQRAMERGEALPDPPAPINHGRGVGAVLEKARNAVNAMGGQTKNSHDASTAENLDGDNKARTLWQKATQGVRGRSRSNHLPDPML